MHFVDFDFDCKYDGFCAWTFVVETQNHFKNEKFLWHSHILKYASCPTAIKNMKIQSQITVSCSSNSAGY